VAQRRKDAKNFENKIIYLCASAPLRRQR